MMDVTKFATPLMEELFTHTS